MLIDTILMKSDSKIIVFYFVTPKKKAFAKTRRTINIKTNRERFNLSLKRKSRFRFIDNVEIKQG